MVIAYTYFIESFILLCAATGMTILAWGNFRSQKRMCIYTTIIVWGAVVLSIFGFGEYRCSLNPDYTFMGTICSVICMSIRPFLLYFFIRIADKKQKKWWAFVIVLAFNVLIYCLALFRDIPEVSGLVFRYVVENGAVTIERGFLNYHAHLVGALFLAYLLYVSIRQLRGKHLFDGGVLFACSFAAVVAVIIESTMHLVVLENVGRVDVLNPTIAISCIFYYMFQFVDESRRDPLTGLFNRGTYYNDIARLGKALDGIIQIDMNGLKYVNDTFGHLEGDKALKTIAETIEKTANKKMYSYRISGDEYTILALGCTLEELENTAKDIATSLSEQGIYVSYGCALKTSDDADMEVVSKRAEKKMYQNKALFYEDSPFERRAPR